MDASGILELGTDGASLVYQASAVNSRLPAQDEQEVLIAAFGRFLHSVSPLQIVVRSERADLHTAITRSARPTTAATPTVAAGGPPKPTRRLAARTI